MYKVIKKKLYYHRQGDIISDDKISPGLATKLIAQGYIEKVEEQKEVAEPIKMEKKVVSEKKKQFFEVKKKKKK